MKKVFGFLFLFLFLSCAYEPKGPSVVRVYFQNESFIEGLLYDIDDSVLTVYAANDLAFQGTSRTYPIRSLKYIDIDRPTTAPAIGGGIIGCLSGAAIGCYIGTATDPDNDRSFGALFRTFRAVGCGFAGSVGGAAAGTMIGYFGAKASGEFDPHDREDRLQLKRISAKGLGL